MIPGGEWFADLPADRGDVDNPPGALRPHRRQNKLGFTPVEVTMNETILHQRVTRFLR
jgi:hypothetical protein